MNFKRLQIIVQVIFLVLPWASGRATQDPYPSAPQVETLMVVKQAPVTGTRLSWTDGTGPYIGVRSQTPNFLNTTTIFYVSRGIAASPLDDPNTLSDTNTYFYQLNDVNTYPEVYTDTSLTDYVYGDTVTLDGTNFSPGSTHVYVEGIEVLPLTSVSSSQIVFNVQASVPSGSITVAAVAAASDGWQSTGMSRYTQNSRMFFTTTEALTPKTSIFTMPWRPGTPALLRSIRSMASPAQMIHFLG